MISRVIIVFLLSVIAALVTLLAAGTIFALVRPQGAQALFTLDGSRRESLADWSSGNDVRVFSGLGRLRVPLSNSSVLILSIAFPYPASDTAFTEELAAKIGDFRTIAAGYFSALPEADIIQIDEDAAKLEILRRFNNTLRLGRLTALYFSDLMIID